MYNYPDIKAVLDRAREGKPVGTGRDASVYLFPEDIPELAPYALRVTHATRPEQFCKTSALTPVDRLIPGMHVGQALAALEASGTRIILRQSGIPLSDMYPESSNAEADFTAQQAHAHYSAEINMYETILGMAEHGSNPFVKLMEQTYQLGRLGYQPDIRLPNIFMDTTKGELAFVDQTDPHRQRSTAFRLVQTTGQYPHISPKKLANSNLDTSLKKLSELAHFASGSEGPEDSALAERYQSLRQEIRNLASQAYETVKSAHPSNVDEPIAFAKTDSVQAVHLSDPPAVLVAQLDALRKLTAIPQR